MKIIQFLLFFTFWLESSGQTYISTKNLDKLWTKDLFCFDSTGKKKRLCSLDLDGFHVRFDTATLYLDSNRLHLIGRIQPGIPFVGIYSSTNESISIKDPLAYTTYGPDNIDKDGFFNISVMVKPGLSLFFYHPSFFVRKYEIFKLVDQLNTKKLN